MNIQIFGHYNYNSGFFIRIDEELFRVGIASWDGKSYHDVWKCSDPDTLINWGYILTPVHEGGKLVSIHINRDCIH